MNQLIIVNTSIILVEILAIAIFFLISRWLLTKFCHFLVQVPLFEGKPTKIRLIRRNVTALMLLTCLVVSLGIIGVNSFLIYQGENLKEYTINLIDRIPSGFWLGLGIAITQSLGVIIAAVFVIKLLHYWLKIGVKKVKSLDQNTADDESVDAFFTTLNRRITLGIWLWIVVVCTQFLKLPSIVTEYLYIGLRIYLSIAIGLLILKAVAAIVDILDVLSIRYSSPDNLLRFYERLRHLVPFLKRCLEFVVYVFTATLVVQQVQLIANLANFGVKIIKIIAIIFISRVVFEIIYLLLEEFLFTQQDLTDTQRSRRLTMIPLFRSLLQYLIYFGVAVSILYTLEINPTPILAGAGIIGIAVGLGAQTLINDIVCGFFILFENYYLVGDYIQAGKAEDKTVEGIVEAIELRTTRIRNTNGQLHIIRNGDIGSITNYSKQYIFATVDISVPANCNLSSVCQVIEEIGKKLKIDQLDVLESTFVEGVESLSESHLLLRTLTKVKPGKHLHIQRVLRQLYIDNFQDLGILLPPNITKVED
ncbi:mechanosensitive ion channel family protein [Cylindrospermopsis curvispora]|uniref:Mechanosensitive ion channel n=1 Tax=Cylindrospermopsis curvispora GIHE-G1 TaxID=2666332 RepID=A0A7H0F0J8_9CYAN|nr:mechanosensitive ion channel domain-containing protein [Cylindrospermopsis curvispora]QNP29564.1 mechanosensitive ion channel [Cylindrospermopsis curvispora GIHE-G1]